MGTPKAILEVSRGSVTDPQTMPLQLNFHGTDSAKVSCFDGESSPKRKTSSAMARAIQPVSLRK